MPRPCFDSIEAYIAAAPAETRPILEQIRSIVERTVPGATPTIAYQMPAFRSGRVFIYFAAFKRHIGIFPPVKGDDALMSELEQYRGEKGNLRFPLDEPTPFDLIGRVVAALAAQYGK